MADTGWTRPTLAELVEQVSDDMIASLGGAAPYVPRSLLWVTSRVIAGTAHVLYGALTYTARQAFVTTADESGVLLHADEMGVTLIPAVAATGWLRFSGTEATVVPVGTEVVRSDGTVYETTSEATIDTGFGAATAVCETTGDAGNVLSWTPPDPSPEGYTFVIASPITGIDSAVTVATDFSSGAGIESIEDLRARVLYKKQHPPQGGAEADYVQWANEYEPVQHAWVVPNYLGAGSVGVFFVVEGSGSGIIPDAGDVAAVETLMEMVDANGYSTRRPVPTTVHVVAPSAVVEDFTLSISPDNAENRDTIEDALNRLFLRRAGAQPTMSDYWLAVGEASVDEYTITAPVTPATVTTTECAVLGTITWT